MTTKSQPTYRRILTSFWTDPEVRGRRLTLEQKHLLLYLFTSPHSNMVGLYWLPLAYAAAETGLGAGDVSEWIHGPLSAYVSYDDDTEEILVHKLARHNIGEDLKAKDNRVKALERGLLDVHSQALLRRFFHIYSDWPLTPGEYLHPEPPQTDGIPTPTIDPKGLTQGAYPRGSEGARGSHSSIMPVSDQSQSHAGPPQGASPSPSRDAESGGHEVHEHEVPDRDVARLREADRQVILTGLHLGSSVVTVNGKPMSMELEMHIRDALVEEWGPVVVNTALPKIRDVEDIPPDQPISLRLLESHPEVITRALAAAALDGPNGPSPKQLGVEVKRITSGSGEDLRPGARQQLQEARRILGA